MATERLCTPAAVSYADKVLYHSFVHPNYFMTSVYMRSAAIQIAGCV